MSKKQIIRISFLGILVIAVSSGFALHHHTTATTHSAPQRGEYVALGDSVAAGDGLARYIDASACDRSAEAYPELVAQKEDYKLISLACSGATTTAGILGSQEVNGLSVASQLTQLYALPVPKLITITIGANDMQWTDILANCYLHQCGSAADSALVNSRLSQLSVNLTNILTSLQSHFGSALPRIVFTGYYQIVPAQLTSCPDLGSTDQASVTWERAQQSLLNQTIQQVIANYTFAHYGAVDFTGHELCSPDPWVQNITSSAPFHPTALGQAAYAKVIE